MVTTDDMLKSYLAGDLGMEERNQVEAALAVDPALEVRLMGLDDMAGAVREAMIKLPDDARIEQSSAIPAIPAAIPGLRRTWAGVAAACLIGIGIGWVGHGFAPDAKADWRTEVAHYQALYTPATIAPIAVDLAQLSAQLATAGAVVQTELPLADLQSVGGLKLLRAQVLGFAGRPLVQIVFEGQNGVPIALCLIRANGGVGEGMTTADRQGLASVAWAHDGVEFLMIGGTDSEWITKRAGDIRARLDART